MADPKEIEAHLAMIGNEITLTFPPDTPVSQEELVRLFSRMPEIVQASQLGEHGLAIELKETSESLQDLIRGTIETHRPNHVLVFSPSEI